MSLNKTSNYSLYVGDLSPLTNEAELFSFFSQIGTVVTVRVTGKPLGYGYVNYAKSEDGIIYSCFILLASKAINTLNYEKIHDKPCRIMWAEKDKKFLQNPQANVFVNNIDKDVDTKTLYDNCTLIGDVVSCKISRDDEGNSLGYGYVQFANEKEAKEAVEKLNGLELGKKPLYACIMGQTSDPSNWTNCFFQNIPENWTEVELGEFMKEVAEPIGIRLLRNKDGSNVGNGCVNFATHEDAVKAVEVLNNKEIKGVKERFVITRYVSKEERRNISKDCDLYVKNIPLTMTDEEFKQLFEPYGEITSIKIERDSSNDKINKGFGYVCYKNKEDAARAIREKDSTIINGKKLYVAVKQTQNERRMNRNQPNNNNNNNYRYIGGNMNSNSRSMYPGYYPVAAGAGLAAGLNSRLMMMNPLASRYAYMSAATAAATASSGNATNTTATGGSGSGMSRGIYATPMMMYPMMRSVYPMATTTPTTTTTRTTATTGTTGNSNNNNIPVAPQSNTTNTSSSSSSSSSQNSNNNLPVPTDQSDAAKKDAYLTHIYNTVSKDHPELAQRITGMFTDMSANDLALIINTTGALDNKITEALNILNNIKK